MNDIDLKDFYIDKITSNGEIIIETDNYLTIQQVCSENLSLKNMSIIIGEPGFGKTISLTKFKNQNKNVFYITVKKSMTPKIFYSKILEIIGFKNYFKQDNIYHIIESISYYLNENHNNNLLIIDEAGKLSHSSILYLHDLRDNCKNSTGIVLAGPKYFENNIRSMLNKNIEGIPEFFRRVNNWIELDKPSIHEKMALCIHRGIKNDLLIKEIATNDNYKTLSDVDNVLNNIGLIVKRKLNNQI